MKTMVFDEILPYLYAEFPLVNEKSIKEVVRHGLSMMTFFKTQGYDLYLNDNHQAAYVYIGQVTMDADKRYLIHEKKIRRKIRLLHLLKKKPYSGYMFFSLKEEAWLNFLQGQTIQRVVLFKCKEEAVIPKNRHYFRVTMEDPKRWFLPIDEFDISTALELQ